MGNLFGSNDLPAALAYDPDSSAFSDAQKEILCEYTDGDFVNDVSDALQRFSRPITALTIKSWPASQNRLLLSTPAGCTTNREVSPPSISIGPFWKRTRLVPSSNH